MHAASQRSFLPAILHACVALALAACGGEEVERASALPAPAPELGSASERVFPGTPPDRVIASVAGRDLSVGHVAAYLELFPTLTVQQAVDDLIDLHAAAARADEAQALRAAPAVEDATRSAYALDWLQRRYVHHPDYADPDPELYAELRTSVTESEPFGVPEITHVSHLLVQVPEGSTPDLWQEAERVAAEIHAELVALERPVGSFDLMPYRANPGVGRAPAPLGIAVEQHFGFPLEYSGRARWSGLEAADADFAQAAFAADVGELTGPVRSAFGVHLILVEERDPAEWVSQSERDALAHQIALSRKRSTAFATDLQGLVEARSIHVFEQNLGILNQSSEERLAAESAARSARYE